MQNVVEERINICRLAEGIGKTAEEEEEEEEEEEREELPEELYLSVKIKNNKTYLSIQY